MAYLKDEGFVVFVVYDAAGTSISRAEIAYGQGEQSAGMRGCLAGRTFGVIMRQSLEAGYFDLALPGPLSAMWGTQDPSSK